MVMGPLVRHRCCPHRHRHDRDGHGPPLARRQEGARLAGHPHGSFLLTDPSLLDAATRMEFDRLLGGVGTHKTVYIRGGNSAVSPDVEKSLRGAGYTVVRYGGGD